MSAYAKHVGGSLWELPLHNGHPALYRDPDDGALLVVLQVNASADVRILRHRGGEWVDDERIPRVVRRDLEGYLRRAGVALSRGAA